MGMRIHVNRRESWHRTDQKQALPTTPMLRNSHSFVGGYHKWYFDELTAEEVNKELEKLKIWWNRKYFLSYPVGCWITAYSRRHLWEAIEKIDKDVLYCDTDSIFYKGHYDWSDFNRVTDARLKAAMDYHGIDFERTIQIFFQQKHWKYFAI